MKQKHDSPSDLYAQRFLFIVFVFVSLFFFVCLAVMNLTTFNLYREGYAPLPTTLGVFAVSASAVYFLWTALHRSYQKLWGKSNVEAAEKAKRLMKPKQQEEDSEGNSQQ